MIAPALTERLLFLSRVVQKEAAYLRDTDERLFAESFSPERVALFADMPELAERVEAFVSRFGRLQDTLGDKLLPALLAALGETPGAAIDNLDRAEKLGWVDSADAWRAMRKLRNLMVHEYVEDPVILASALQSGHAFVPALMGSVERFATEIVQRTSTRRDPLA